MLSLQCWGLYCTYPIVVTVLLCYGYYFVITVLRLLYYGYCVVVIIL